MSLQTWHDSEGNLKPFKWEPKKIKAAALIAEGKSHPKIARELDISIDVIKYWTRHPDFALRVKKLLDDYAQEVAMITIANRVHRVQVLNDLEERLLAVVESRAEGPADPHTGMETGMVLRREKVTQTRTGGSITETEYEVDTGLSSEIRALHKQAAQETGQWSEKSEIELSGGIERTYILEDDEGNVLVEFDVELEIKKLDSAEGEPE